MPILLVVALTLSSSISTADSDAFLQIQKRAIQGDSSAQFWVGIAYQRGRGIPADQSEATKWIRRSANSGNPDAQNWMGQAYQEGEGVKRDYAAAAHWYSLACENRPDYGGAGQGCNNLGLLYFDGKKGFARNFVLAYLYARMARNEEQAAICARHITITQRKNSDDRYAQWLRRHGEKPPSSR